MESLADMIRDSRDRVSAQSSALLSTTREAGEAFVEKTRQAGGEFFGETREAGSELYSTTRVAQNELFDTVKDEVDVWLAYFRSETEKLLSAENLPKLTNGGNGSAEGVKVPAFPEMEKKVLESVEKALADLEKLIGERLEALEAQLALPASSKKAPASKKVAKKAKKAIEDAAVTPSQPVSGYDKLTAKEITTKLQRMKKAKAKEVLAYERAHKKRTTVINAAKAKIAA